LLELRQAFLKRNGPQADLRQFHAIVLEAGPMPLDLVADRLRTS
jgi:uncharacterized protein (DUF885 family)